MPRLAHGLEGVDRLAGLAHADHERPLVEDGVAVTELRRDVDLRGEAGPSLDRVLGDEARVVARAARDDHDLVDLEELLAADPALVENDRPVGREPPEQGVRDRTGLLVHLLAHEVVVTGLLGGFEVPVDMKGDRLHDFALEGGHPQGPRADLRDLVVLQRPERAGDAEESGDVGGEEADA